jgi:hypothetical protein
VTDLERLILDTVRTIHIIKKYYQSSVVYFDILGYMVNRAFDIEEHIKYNIMSIANVAKGTSKIFYAFKLQTSDNPLYPNGKFFTFDKVVWLYEHANNIYHLEIHNLVAYTKLSITQFIKIIYLFAQDYMIMNRMVLHLSEITTILDNLYVRTTRSLNREYVSRHFIFTAKRFSISA